MYDVVALGELLIDFTCKALDKDGYPTMEAHPGGAPANYLAALAKFGAKTALLGKVGDDAFGRLLRSSLGRAGIDDGRLSQPVMFLPPSPSSRSTKAATGSFPLPASREPTPGSAPRSCGWITLNKHGFSISAPCL